MRLTKKDIKNWVAALRSGDYEQGTNYLCQLDPVADEARYCCLGVLNEELYGESCWKLLREELTVLVCDGHLTGPSLDLAGAMAKRGLYTAVLAQMNDSGKTFEEIADYIEKVAL